jgi:hypothetical protein
MTNPLGELRAALPRLLKLDRRLDEVKINQGLILSQMQYAAKRKHLWEYEFKVFSQWGEDGIVQYLVSHLDIRNRTFIEFGVEDFSESNCRFLMMKDRWSGFVIDGSEQNIERLKNAYYFWQYPLSCRSAFITKENIGALLEESHFDKEIGILSVDIDGIDYHVLEALADWHPAILIIEYNEAFGSSRPVSVPYDPTFVRHRKHFSNQYWGASLPAFCYLTGRRGYGLVGTNSVRSNAFFVRRDLLNDTVREVGVADCSGEATYRDTRDQAGRLTFISGLDRRRLMADMPLIDVSTGTALQVKDLND